MNQIIIKGRLTKDPESSATQSGIAVCKITVAVDRSYAKDGEKKADFFRVTFWRQSAEFVSKYFTKGKEILVSGEMQSQSWKDKDGNDRISWEIGNARAEFCGGNGSGSGSDYKNASGSAAGGQSANEPLDLDDFEEILSDDGVPF